MEPGAGSHHSSWRTLKSLLTAPSGNRLKIRV
jgi:hypothetical protein